MDERVWTIRESLRRGDRVRLRLGRPLPGPRTPRPGRSPP
ncbi:hypothetical protein BJ981_002579 [Sphaerisporangium krabiense]|uniref:Uncharacterized protein n=1 Tax=Sphaerisporangium krabiense TaxID=763782 RepID=A0A7W8Z440_9ACTN|nr:hypothetical protein [Sphaerisporangium krabiense]